ncbi:hypothetical protein SFR_4656 [Streptomyces sp. FR-008]|nr:hypothetical protein SFR_4656 [Streptomyces sp. FR-008]
MQGRGHGGSPRLGVGGTASRGAVPGRCSGLTPV